MGGQSLFVEAAGYELHVTEWGAGQAETVVMWHGLARTGRDFDDLADALSDRYRVLCPDTIGRGLSQWAKDRDRDYSIAVYARTALAMLAALKVDRMRWIGTSMGGVIGMVLAAGPLRDRISHLLLNDIGPELPREAVERILAYAGNPPVFDTMAELEQWLRTAYAPFGDNPDAFWRRMTVTSARRLADGRVTLHYDPKIVSQFVAHPHEFENWPAFAAIACPILLLRGAESDLLTRPVADAMVARNENCRLTQIDGYGHVPALNTPEQIAMVREFLA